MKVIQIAALPAQPWKNGGGVTREIAQKADDRGMIWRLSVADVARAGPFSHFPGLTRVLTVIEGAGLLLRHPDGVIKALHGAPVRFSGETAIDCDLIDGPVRDFNLIHDAARRSMDVIRLDAGEHRLRGLGLLTLDGAALTGAGEEIPAGAFARFESGATQTITVRGSALLVTTN